MVKVFIQNERNSREKKIFNEETLEYRGKIDLCCPLPYPYGFIPGTLGDDGDCVDFWVITREDLKTGTLVDCDPLGLLEIFENDEDDFKILGHPVGEQTELTDDIYKEIRDFTYQVFTQFPETTIRVGRLLSRQAALEFIQKSEKVK